VKKLIFSSSAAIYGDTGSHQFVMHSWLAQIESVLLDAG
jgi:UDP-glucose 4-epimerase